MENIKREQYNQNFEAGRLEQFPDDLFEKRNVVVLRETFHGKHDETILYFLNKFGSQIDHVFIELHVNYQDSVAKYFITGEVDNALEGYFRGAEKEGKNIRGLLRVFDKIKEIKKGVSCFDSSKIKEGEYQKASKYGRYFLRGESRDEDMFVNFQRYYERMPGKYLLIVGDNHGKGGRYPGGDERLGERLKKFFREEYASFRMRRKE